MHNRRKFIKLSAFGIPMLSSFSSLSRDFTTAMEQMKPIVISTWDFGIAANQAAWKVLSRGGRALDAVEQGVHVPEADPKNQSVGYGGLPDRDGHVTLDACIMD